MRRRRRASRPRGRRFLRSPRAARRALAAAVMIRVLVTRPREEAVALAARLEALGYTPVIAPMIAVRFLPDAVMDASGIQAVAFTSANGARALAAARVGAEVARDLPAFAVGKATAAAARAAGFREIVEGPGTV